MRITKVLNSTNRKRGQSPRHHTEPSQAQVDVTSGAQRVRWRAVVTYAAVVRAVLIVNPQATATTRGGRDVLAHALASEVKLEVVETDYRGHAMTVARSAMREGIDLVVAHGGDGTVNEVVNGMLADSRHNASPPAGRHGRQSVPPTIGVVPGGSANVFARAVGIPRDPVEATYQLLHAIEQGRWQNVGLGLADRRWFTFNAGLGWDADVVAGVERKRGKQTSPGLYARTALSAYLRPPQGRAALTVRTPGTESVRAMTAFISNTDPWSYLGSRPVHLNPGCSFEAGLGLFALRKMTAPTVLRHLRQALRGKSKQRGRRLIREDDLPIVRIDADKPVNFQVDGDLIGQRTSVEFRSVPHALSVMV